MDRKLTRQRPRPRSSAAASTLRPGRRRCRIGAPDGGEPAARRHLLLPALHAVQAARRLDQPRARSTTCAARLAVPPAEAYGVATFYALFSIEPRPPRVAHVCDDIACARAAARRSAASSSAARPAARRDGVDWIAALPRPVRARAGGAGAARGPAPTRASRPRRRDRDALAPARPSTAEDARRRRGSAAGAGVAASTVGARRPAIPRWAAAAGSASSTRTSLDDYRAHGGYAALRRALALGPAGVIREVTDSRSSAAAAPPSRPAASGRPSPRPPARPHYLVCNADESEPGTFKDRVLMESDPFALIEAMTIAGFATGCERGYLYIRGEYPLATRSAAARDRRRRAPAASSATTSWRGLRASTSSCGAAPAPTSAARRPRCFNSIEGLRGEPRNKPPFPVESACSASPPSSTTSRRWSTCSHVLDVGGPAFAASAPGVHRARSSSALRRASAGRACTRCRSASRCGS